VKSLCCPIPSLAPRHAPRKLRLYEMKSRDVLTAQCSCGHFSRFASGELQRHHKLPSDLLVYDLQCRLRCRVCQRKKGMRIILWAGEPMPSKSPHDVGHHRVIVEGEVPERVRI
jgi:hypothetical protein